MDKKKRLEATVEAGGNSEAGAEKSSSPRLGDLAATVAHQMRNPLSAIGANAELLLEDLSEADTRRQDVGAILFEIAQLNKTVDELVRFAHTRRPFLLPVDVTEDLERALEELEPLCAACAVRIRRDYSAHGTVMTDSALLQEVYSQLGRNALEAMPDGGILWVATRQCKRPAAPALEVCFTDTGPGIPPDLGGLIFEPFFTTKPINSGLGLAVCRKILRLMGGEVRAEPDPPSTGGEIDGGARMVVTLPRPGRRQMPPPLPGLEKETEDR